MVKFLCTSLNTFNFLLSFHILFGEYWYNLYISLTTESRSLRSFLSFIALKTHLIHVQNSPYQSHGSHCNFLYKSFSLSITIISDCMGDWKTATLKAKFYKVPLQMLPSTHLKLSFLWVSHNMLPLLSYQPAR